MKRRVKKIGWKILAIFIAMFLLAVTEVNVNDITVTAQSSVPEIGYELLDDKSVLHLWNRFNDYYFNTSSGIQLTNHYKEFWSHNVLMLAYFINNNWKILFRSDDLSNFNKNIDTDNENYVNVTLWKDLAYYDYDFRLAIRYCFGVNDTDLTVIPYIKNLGQEIPFNLAFGWEIKDIKIANTTKDNYLQIYNGTCFEKILLNQTLDRNFSDMNSNTTIKFIYANPLTHLLSKNLYLSWDRNLTYKVSVKSSPDQYNAPTTLFIRIGTLGVNKEKFTEMHWLDSDDRLGISSNHSFPAPEITELVINGTIYHQVTMDELPIEGGIGIPMLPVKPLDILLPQSYILDSIEVTWDGIISLGEGFNVELGKEPIAPGRQKMFNESINFDPTVPYPTELIEEVSTNEFRGYNILTCILFPVHYVGETGEIFYYNDMSVTVTTINTGSVSNFFRGLPEDMMLMESSVDNYDMVSTYIEKPQNPLYHSCIVNPSESYDYVIITNNNLKNEFQTLVDYKNNRGTTTKIVTVEEIESCPDYYWDGAWGDGNPFFDDILCHIRNFIKDAFHNWNTNYILLGGDTSIIPVRDFRILFVYVISELVPSDLYYAALDRNFNLDRDEYWGEIGDIPDLRAEVFIGRACVETGDEVTNFIEKTLAYLNTPTTDSYINEVLMAGEELAFDTYGGDNLDELIDISTAGGFLTIGIPSDEYNINKLYDKDWGYWGWPKSEIINYINSNIHFLCHDGHSNYHYNMKMEEIDVDNLNNDKYCFIYSVGCNAGGFDEECIAEHFTVKTNHGAFAGIWNTRTGWFITTVTFGPSSNFQRQFWDAIFHESHQHPVMKEIGVANHDSKNENIWRLRALPYVLGAYNRYCFYEITLFGDPQIMIKTPGEPAPGWVVPSNHYDPDDSWDYEILAYDNDIDTKAGCTISNSHWNEWVWTPWLELTLPASISCDKIRFYAWYNLLHCDEIDYYVYGDETYHRSGYFNKYEWVIDNIPGGAITNVYMAKVRFHVRRGLWPHVTADLHEFQFHQI